MTCQCRTHRRIIVILCLFGLAAIAYACFDNAILSGATALAVGSPFGDYIA